MLIGKKVNMDHKDFHIADIKETWADIAKAEKLLGWKPTIDINEGLKRTVDSFNKFPILNEVDLPPS
jgi:nucleoside-diphosphate-sugar epimerase